MACSGLVHHFSQERLILVDCIVASIDSAIISCFCRCVRRHLAPLLQGFGTRGLGLLEPLVALFKLCLIMIGYFGLLGGLKLPMVNVTEDCRHAG